jgi:AcrR family transcriptional regulator
VTVNGFPGTVGHMSAVPTPVSSVPVANRRDRRTARTRQAIIEAAKALIDEQGYPHTTIDQIAERADVAPRTFFRHFASKEAVLFADFEESRREMLDLIRAQPLDQDPLCAVLDGLAAFCDVIAADPDRFSWAINVIERHDLHYEQQMLKAETGRHLSAFVAERLGVDPDTDPRPGAWALIGLAMFGNAMKSSLGGCRAGHPRACFDSLVAATGDCFRRAVTDPAR